jgi:hypothetical protein
MSELPPPADLSTSLSRVSKVPIRARRLFDHLVGAFEQRWRDGQAKRLGGLELITSSYLVGACTEGRPDLCP